MVARKKTSLSRFGVSLDTALLERFDAFISGAGYTNRSKALADLIRREFVSDVLAKGGNVAGAITIVYDHHQREVVNKLLDIQHDHGGIIISTQHVHLDHDSCLEVAVLRGQVAAVREFGARVIAERGVIHGRLVEVPAQLSSEKHTHGGTASHRHVHTRVG